MNFLKGKGLTASLALLGLTLIPSSLNAAEMYDTSVYVKTDINSGNPVYPFPQFLEYKVGKSLAKYNAEGVTHADMEKTMREAYQIMSHRCRYTGDTYCGVPYITFNNPDVEGNYGVFCTEGDGYMLLASAIFADQPTFNGLWMWIHDNRMSKVKKYSDGEWLRKGLEKDGRLVCGNYEAGPLAGWKATGDEEACAAGSSDTHSASDGDYDIAMALLIANKQWGEFMYQDGKQVKDASGDPISYKEAAQFYIKALVDTIPQYDTRLDIFEGYLTGDIGVDGYCKGGNSFGDLTAWADSSMLDPKEGLISPSITLSGHFPQYVDYNAPSYFTEFAKWLEEGDGEGTEWQINQFKRAAASSDWIVGQLYEQGGIPSVGKCSITKDNKVEFSQFSGGEDFRFAWRNLLSYLWHGNPSTTWNPETHAVEEGGNTFEHDMAVRYAEYLKSPEAYGYKSEGKCGILGASPSPVQLKWFGPAQIAQCYNMDGSVMDAYHTNYALGCSGPSIVALGDEELLGDIYRECELRWDGNDTEVSSDDDRYINSTPRYFHGWFRTLGMLVTSGNMAAPADMKANANVKVYMSVDKTAAYKGDLVTYGVQCRNYGSADANDVVVTTKLAPEYEFVSATDGGVYDDANHSITWKIGKIDGFKTGKLEATIDSLNFTVKVVGVENSRVALTSVVSGSNFKDWVSNEYPNNATYTMERNVVDLTENPLALVKSINVEDSSVYVNDTIEYVLKIDNSDSGPLLNGGRNNVRLSYANYSDMNYMFYQYVRFNNDASEAYIDLSNYRISYFLYDTCSVDGLTYTIDNFNDLEKFGFAFDGNSGETEIADVPEGMDEYGKWNKRVTIRFPHVLHATSSHIDAAMNNPYLIHKGGHGPLFYRTRLSKLPMVDMSEDLVDDWSFSKSLCLKSVDGQQERCTIVSPGWYTSETMGEELDTYARHSCDEADMTFDRVLVEEWDGYRWRRIQGSAPNIGMSYKNVVLVDTLPKEIEFIDQIDDSGISIVETDGVLKVSLPELKAHDVITLKCRCKVAGNVDAGIINMKAASLSADNNFVMSNPLSLQVNSLTDVKVVNVDPNELVDVYNTNGGLMKKQVEYKNALTGLQPGVYMVNGVKTIVK